MPAEARYLDPMRADQLLVARGLAASRSAAQRLIRAGRVSLDGQRIGKASQPLPEDADPVVRPDPEDRYVSRAGLKLAGALRHTALDIQGLTALDLGQSTGGFTDCLLQAGAARVVGIEVGHDQLHPRLRGDPRVCTLEGVNARDLLPAHLGREWPEGADGGGFDLVVADLSFISLSLVLPRVPALLTPHGRLLALVKPQFEVGPAGLGKGGIVREPRLYTGVQGRIHDACGEAGLRVLDYFDSPITGGDGNREFFVHADR